MLAVQKAADLPPHFSETAKSGSKPNQSIIQFENHQKAVRIARDFLAGRIRVMKAAEQLSPLSSDCVGVDQFDTDLFAFVMIHTHLSYLFRHSAPESMDDPQILSFEAECVLKAFHAASNLVARLLTKKSHGSISAKTKIQTCDYQTNGLLPRVSTPTARSVRDKMLKPTKHRGLALLEIMIVVSIIATTARHAMIGKTSDEILFIASFVWVHSCLDQYRHRRPLSHDIGSPNPIILSGPNYG